MAFLNVPVLWAVGQKIKASTLNMMVAAILEMQSAMSEIQPSASVFTSGTAQNISAATVVTLTGNGSGWAAGAAVGTGITVSTGVRASPIKVARAGLYVIEFRITHNSTASGRAFSNVVLAGGTSATYRSLWPLDDSPSATLVVALGVNTTITLQTYSNVANTINSASIMVRRISD